MMRKILILLLFCPFFLLAQSDESTLSPYFVVNVDSGMKASLPLKHTSAEVNVAGVIADVTITQVYQNEGEATLEAIYVFPSSTRAAVYAMEMQVGNKVIEAKIQEKQEAREMYEEAKEKGQTASLLEQERPNVFSMNVANILPGDSIVVRLSYTELLVPTEGEYEFVYPTVVAPRYSQATASDSNAAQNEFAQTPYTPKGIDPLFSFDFVMNVAAGMPVSQVNSSTHTLETVQSGEENVQIRLTDSVAHNRDIVIRYSLRGNEIQSGLLTYRGQGEKFFLLMAQPPKRIVPEQIPPREYIFVMDVSGSMSGYPIETSKEMMRNLLKNMRPQDRFNVIQFAGGSAILQEGESLAADDSSMQKAMYFVDHAQAGGGTAVLPALERALALKRTKGMARVVVICSDGLVTVEKEAYELIRENMNEMNVFTFGIGRSTNRYLLEGLAHVGQGEVFFVDDANQAKESAERFKKYVESPILIDVEADFGEMEVYDVEPIRIPDVFAERPVLVYGKYKGKLEGNLTIQGISGGEQWQQQIHLPKIKPNKKHRAIRYLWARERIRLLSDYQQVDYGDSSLQDSITQIGLDYNLLTDYTSFIAIYKKKRAKNDSTQTVKQPNPLPDGMENGAVGSGSLGVMNTEGSASSLSIRGARDNSNVYVVDGQKLQSMGTRNVSSLSEVVIVDNRSTIYSTDCRNPTQIKVSEHTIQHLWGEMLIHQLSNIWRGSEMQLNGMPLFGTMGSHSFLEDVPYQQLSSISFWNGGGVSGYQPINGLTNLSFQKPYGQRSLKVFVEGSHLGEMSAGISGHYRIKNNLTTRLWLNGDFTPTSIDRNQDNFLDIPQKQSLFAMNEWFYQKGNSQFQFGGMYDKNVQEAGRDIYALNRDRENASIYAKGYHFFSDKTYNNSLHASVVAHQHRQEALFGSRLYDGKERMLDAQAYYQLAFKKQQLQVGALYRYNRVDEQLEALAYERTESSGGLMLAYQTLEDHAEGFQFKAGGKLLYHNLWKWIISPNASLSWRKRYSRVTLTAGRFVQMQNPMSNFLLWMQNNRAIALGNLRPNEAWHLETNTTHLLELGSHNLHFHLRYKYLRYQHRLIGDPLADANHLYVESLTGSDQHLAIGTFTYRSPIKLSFNASYTYNRDQVNYIGGKQQLPLSPQHRGIIAANYMLQMGGSHWNFELASEFTGAQSLFDGGLSPAFSTLNAKVDYHFKQFIFSLKAENLLDYRQETPVLNAETPYQLGFEASQVWGPVVGRRIVLGISWELGK